VLWYVYKIVSDRISIDCGGVGVCPPGFTAINFDVKSWVSNKPPDVSAQCDDICVKFPQVKQDIYNDIAGVNSSINTLLDGLTDAFTEIKNVSTNAGEIAVKFPRAQQIEAAITNAVLSEMSCDICSHFCAKYEQKCSKTCGKWCRIPYVCSYGCKLACKTVAGAQCEVFEPLVDGVCNVAFGS